MIQIQKFVFNPFQENTYVVWDQTKEAVIIDPGNSNHEENQLISDFIEANELNVVLLLNTHCHVDHVLGNQYIHEMYRAPFKIYEIEEPILRSVKVYAPSYGFYQYQEILPHSFLKEGEKILFGDSFFDVLFVPGHSPGHVAFYNPDQRILIGGDVLFARSIGRTDLPGGNFEALLKSIRTKFFPLPADVTVYPGHGPETTIGEEKSENPFLQQ